MLSRALVVVAALAVLAPRPARAQEYTSAPDRVVGGGGEVSVVVGPRDNTAFFNYTDYDRNGLRITRVRLFGEWRPLVRLSIVGELRTENASDVTAPALYARWRPSATHDVVIHAGRIPAIVGGFARHAYGRDNVVLGQPLAYQYLTSLRPDALPATTEDLVRMRGRGWQPSYPIGSSAVETGIPLIAVSRWDTGVAGIWRIYRMELAGAVTRGSPAIPIVKETNSGLMWSGRAAARLPGSVTVGVSAARAPWIEDTVLGLISNGASRPTSQSIVGTDLEAGFGHWLVRGEWLRSSFDLPVGVAPGSDLRLRAWSGFAEARYRPHPRWQAGLRLERLSFSQVLGAAGPISWDADVDRVEGVLGLRLSRRVEVRGGWQHNWRAGGRVRERGLPVAAVLYWF